MEDNKQPDKSEVIYPKNEGSIYVDPIKSAPPPKLDNLSPEMTPQGSNTEAKRGLISKIKDAAPSSVYTAIGIFTLVAMFLVTITLIVGKAVPGMSSEKVNPRYESLVQRCNSEAKYSNYQTCINNGRDEVSQNLKQPDIKVLIGVGFIMIILTTILLQFIRSKIGYKWSWLILAAAYNSVIIVMKFIVSPTVLYSAVINVDSNAIGTAVDPNNAISVVITSIGVFLLYLGVLYVVYNIYRKLVRKDLNLTKQTSSSAAAPEKPKRAMSISRNFIITIVVAVVAVVTGAWMAVLLLPLILFGSSLQYLGYVFNSVGILVILALILFVATFSTIRQQIKETKNIALLASFFYIAFCLIISIHAIWVVFMALLALLWPFNVTYYSSK